MTYRADVEFLELCNPALIERNAQEYRRLHQLLESTDTAFLKATRTEWVSEANDLYDKRLREAESLATHLSSAFRKVWKALIDYADAVERAKKRFESGRSSEVTLSGVMSRVAEPVTEKAQRAEPMHQWEDLRKRTGVIDWLAEITLTSTRSGTRPSGTTTRPSRPMVMPSGSSAKHGRRASAN